MLRGKNIIVTGGNGLLGREICEDIRKKGGIALNFDIHHSEVSDENFICDITSSDSISECLNQVEHKFGAVHGLVNNAYPRTKDWGTAFEEMSFESLQTNVDCK